ncbi:MAG: OPT/YSL family transporter [Cyanobacteria bacterium SZAS LIN-2]|nr:OPT/YSL family transporter [Cyanobacteria bacterium SZAS LIN-3]MBS1996108.1 OPT/YSL family transporter [Cyanobacteria bacterium SZAS LIN-2]
MSDANEMSELAQTPGEAAEGLPRLVVEPVDENSEEYWYTHVYQGDKVPQLTLRAVLMGGLLGAVMSISNLYTMLKVGWAFGVAITACVLSFVIWRLVRFVFRNVSDMSILENNCMQSAASSAGYSTGATVGLAFGALLMIQGHHQPWQVVLPWTVISALLGVFLAVPMKKQMINVEKLAFPSGIAAAQTLKSLHAQSLEATKQAYSLVIAMAIAAITGFMSKGEFAWQLAAKLKLPEIIPFKIRWMNVNLEETPGFGFEPSLLLIGAGMLVGLRVSASMLIGSLALYFYFGPQALAAGQISNPHGLIKEWALWTGSAIMVTSGLTAMALEWRTIMRSFSVLKKTPAGQEGSVVVDHSDIEVPVKWLVIGIIPLAIASIILQYVAFSIAPHIGFITVSLSFLLALVACRATGETDVTPMSAMGKITQLTVAVLAPKAIVTNLMAASVTANIASSSADLLTDLKSGYLLGANPRKQFIAQLSGVFFGVAAIIPAWYLMVPDKAALDAFEPPSVNIWKAVATALSLGIDNIPMTARYGMLIGGLLGIALSIAEKKVSKSVRPFIPSAMGLGLSWVMPFQNALAFFIGAVIAEIWSRISSKNAELYVVPVASGAVAGESLMCAIIAIITAAAALTHH